MWALAVTRPRAEMAVSERLKHYGIDSCVFKHRISHIRRGRKIERLTPAFPRYVFVRISDQVWRFVLELRNRNGFNLVHDWVRSTADSFGDRLPAVIHTSVIDRLKSTAQDDVLPTAYQENFQFKFGDRVRISAGRSVTTGCEAIYQYRTSPSRVCVLLPWLGRLVNSEVDENEIEPMQRSTEPVRSANHRRRHGRRGGRRRHRQRMRSRATATV